MTVRRSIGREYWGNCWLLSLKLWLLGRITHVISQKRSWQPPHTLGVTKRGHIVHFKASKKRPKCNYWLRGRVEVVRGSAWKSK